MALVDRMVLCEVSKKIFKIQQVAKKLPKIEQKSP